MDLDHSQIWNKIVAKAWKDPEFKARLLKNPKETVLAFWQKENPGRKPNLPPNFKVRVVEEEPDTYTAILPQAPSDAEDLSDEKLRSLFAAGGPPCCICLSSN